MADRPAIFDLHPKFSGGASLFNLGGAAVMVLLLSSVIAIGFYWRPAVSRSLTGFSALWHTHDMLVRYVQRTGGDWPDSWADLADDFGATDPGYGSQSLDGLQEVIAVNFDVDPESLRVDEKLSSSVRLVWLKSGRPSSELDAANDNLRILFHTQEDE